MTQCQRCWKTNPAEIHTCTPWYYFEKNVLSDTGESMDRKSLASKLNRYDQSVLMWRQGMWYTKKEDVIEFISEFYDEWSIPWYMIDVVDDVVSGFPQ